MSSPTHRSSPLRFFSPKKFTHSLVPSNPNFLSWSQSPPSINARFRLPIQHNLLPWPRSPPVPHDLHSLHSQFRTPMHRSSSIYPPQHYWIQTLCRVPNALGKGYFALGKAFAEGSTRQRASGKKSVGKEFFVERFLSGTRQSLRRVQSRHSAKKSDRHAARMISSACIQDPIHLRARR